MRLQLLNARSTTMIREWNQLQVPAVPHSYRVRFSDKITVSQWPRQQAQSLDLTADLEAIPTSLPPNSEIM